jgi:hypothetical protein
MPGQRVKESYGTSPYFEFSFLWVWACTNPKMKLRQFALYHGSSLGRGFGKFVQVMGLYNDILSGSFSLLESLEKKNYETNHGSQQVHENETKGIRPLGGPAP